MKVNDLETFEHRKSSPVYTAGLLSGLLWIGLPIYIGSTGMQITHIMSLLLFISFFLYEIGTRNYGKLRIGLPIFPYMASIFISIFFILSAGILSGLNALSLLEVFKFEVGYVIGFLMLYIFLGSLKRDKDINFIISFLLWGGVIVVTISLVGYFIPFIGAVTLNPYRRAEGFVLHPNQFGIMLAAILPVAAANLAAAYHSVRRWSVLVILLTGLIISGSKTNLFIAAVLCPTVLMIISLTKQKFSQRIASFFGAGLVAIFSGIFGFFMLRKLAPETLLNLQILLADPDGYRSILSRKEIWEAALTLAKKHPFFGIGAGNTPFLLEVRHCHNVFIEYYLTLGWFGLASLIFFFLSLLFVGWYMLKISKFMSFAQRARTIGLAAGMISYLLSNQLSDSFGPTTMPIFWVILGLLLAQGNSWMLNLSNQVKIN